MWKKIIMGGVISLLAQSAFAEDINCEGVSANNSSADKLAQCQAHSFINIYVSTCVKHLTELDVLRRKLAPLPKLPPEKAKKFLQGRAGDAWPVPDMYGTFVLAIPENTHFCAVYGLKADSVVAQQQFLKMVAQAPAPFMVKQRVNEEMNTVPNGAIKMVAYQWSLPNATLKMLFTLSTARSDAAQFQVLGSAALITD